MYKIAKQLMEEDPGIYPAEESYLRQEPNEMVYHVNGKAIVRSDGGKLLFTPLSDDEKEFFVFGAQLDAGDLLPVTELKEADQETLHCLQELDESLNGKNLHAMAIERPATGNGTVTVLITHSAHPENTYFRISVPELNALTPEQIDELPSYNEERTLANPYHIQLDGGKLIVY